MENILRSSRFYYGIIIFLTVKIFFKHFHEKAIIVYGLETLSVSYYFTIVSYFAIYLSLLISALLFYRKIPAYLLITWVSIVLISIINELRGFLEEPNIYSLKESFFTARTDFTEPRQGLINVRVTFAILFISIWHCIKDQKWTKKTLVLIENLVVINSILILFAIIFEIEIFKSYPLSSRWGFSGILARGYCVTLTSIFLISSLNKKEVPLPKVLIFILTLLVSGTKAGLLSLLLIFIIVIVKNKKTKILLLLLSVIGLAVFAYKLDSFIQFSSPFFQNVYQQHGAYGLIFSLRNQDFITLLDIIKNSYSVVDWLIGGKLTHEQLWVEMAAVDIFVYYGLVGGSLIVMFFSKIIPTISKSIPILVACLSGGIISGPYAMIVYGIWLSYREK